MLCSLSGTARTRQSGSIALRLQRLQMTNHFPVHRQTQSFLKSASLLWALVHSCALPVQQFTALTCARLKHFLFWCALTCTSKLSHLLDEKAQASAQERATCSKTAGSRIHPAFGRGVPPSTNRLQGRIRDAMGLRAAAFESYQLASRRDSRPSP
ncbi:hypothetical protein KOR42_18710 [Thalassoglobus neptunius]|uniref:Uncharacterized protein n=1 Tax=Thalassoglobus neptunius TaxID=1938619 RepID=A0A5C5X650_9PLAN|nr:hypothetical protein KOR42_18710 [Thalassoglobus neptunius]